MRNERRWNLTIVAALLVACAGGGDAQKDDDTAADDDTDIAPDTDDGIDTDTDTDGGTDTELGTDEDGDGHTVEDGDCIDDDPRFTGVADRFVEVGVGQTTGCALDSAGVIHCWGDDYGAVLGSGISTEPCHRQIETGGGWGWLDFVCTLDVDHQPACWGYVDPDADTSEPHPVVADAPPGPLTDLVAGGDFACGLEPDGFAVCWGGPEETRSNAAMAGLMAAGPYVQITAGWETTCGLTAAGGMECFGDDRFGDVSGAPSGPVASAHAFGLSVCALDSAGRADCWGHMADQLSDIPDTFFTDAPAVLEATGDLYTACLLRADGGVACAGNEYGEHGDPASDFHTPDPSGSFVQLEAGLVGACGVHEDGTLACWGPPNGDAPHALEADAPSLP